MNIPMYTSNDLELSLLMQVKDCPYCGRSIHPTYLNHVYHNEKLVIISCCPSCNNLVIANYQGIGRRWWLNEVFPYNQTEIPFSDNIRKTSESFCKIYNQAEKAENLGLNEICGVGYRKALEFLIKDYIISNHPEDEEKIKAKPLKKCIDDYIDYQEIKECATRAVFLGNDETHYIRKWENKDINDLKILIDLTVKWIELNLTTKNICNSMPIESEK